MKKLVCLLLFCMVILAGCISVPVPNIEQTVQNADPNSVVGLTNDATGSYFRAALPIVTSDTRGLIQGRINNRADIAQVEMSLLRLASEFFDDESLYLREGQFLPADFIVNVLRMHNPDLPLSLPNVPESPIGLNPPLGSTIDFGSSSFTSDSTTPIRPLVYILEQNFTSINESSEFELEGVALALALNPYYWEVDRSIGLEVRHRMSDEDIISIGQDISASLLPLVRNLEGMDEIPILIGLFILRDNSEILPGHFATMTYVDNERLAIGTWQPVHERHFSLPDSTGLLQNYDFSLIHEFDFFSTNVINHFPHRHSLIAQVHVVNESVFRISMTFTMNFGGAAEKLAFHQLLELEVMQFSPHYDINIIIQDLNNVHGIITREPYSQVFVHRVGW